LSTFDPQGQLHILSQALANQNTALGFMIGAGCPCSISGPGGGPLIPATAELTNLVAQTLRDSRLGTQFAFLERQYSDDGIPLPNVEELLTRVRTLREITGTRTHGGLSAANLDELDSALCKAIQDQVSTDLPQNPTSYSMFARWIREVKRGRPVEIFTTNYDLLLEKALERARAPFFDGFVGAHAPFFDVAAMELDRLPERWTRVWKVHGSINWRLTDDQAIVRTESGTNVPLIYPSNLKYAQSRRLPYFAMRDRLREFIRSRSVLIACGYSFSDEHLNEDITFGLTANAGSVCYGLLFGPIENYPRARGLAAGHSNLNLLAQNGGVLRGREQLWGEGATLDIGDFHEFGMFLIREVMGEPEDM
jgi:hypothetical protein